jgi:hypothetical protein
MQVGGLGGLGLLDPVMTGSAMLAANAAYSRPVRSLVMRGAGGSLPRAVQEQLSRLPFTSAQLAAQVGRHELTDE